MPVAADEEPAFGNRDAVGFNGLALRVVPDPDVDDGYTVRVNLPKSPKVYLEIDTCKDSAR